MVRNVLFICEGNLHRSPTAEEMYGHTPGIRAKSAGLSPMARVQVTQELLAWADVVFVMEVRLLKLLRKNFTIAKKQVVCLDIPDDFQRGQPELVAILTERISAHLGSPIQNTQAS
ncbi:MAG: low molecular weight protein tyrosine phosphatase family protein [Fimbriiglobus sp.]